LNPRANTLVRFAKYGVSIILLGFTAFAAVEYASGTQPIYVISDSPSSMSPTLNYGTAVAVYRYSFASLRPGDVIVFRDPRGNPGILVHRIVSVGVCPDGQFCAVTKGDNNSTNPSPDPWTVTNQYYLGKVITYLPYAGYLSPALWGFGGLQAIFPLALIFLSVAFVSVIRKPGHLEKKQEAGSTGGG
jgi:signal peptidase I